MVVKFKVKMSKQSIIPREDYVKEDLKQQNGYHWVIRKRNTFIGEYNIMLVLNTK